MMIFVALISLCTAAVWNDTLTTTKCNPYFNRSVSIHSVVDNLNILNIIAIVTAFVFVDRFCYVDTGNGSTWAGGTSAMLVLKM
jgi:hypothetical protein